MASTENPWSVPIAVAQIPEEGLHRDIAADAATCAALAGVAGLTGVSSATASFDVAHERGGRVRVTGQVQARIGQICVVTLDPIENDIDETVDLEFAPPDQIPALADLVEEAAESDEEIPDPPEPIVNGTIDLGRIAADAIFLGIDPYPRKPGATFNPPAVEVDPDEHPFAALKALQGDRKPGSGKPNKRDGDA